MEVPGCHKRRRSDDLSCLSPELDPRYGSTKCAVTQVKKCTSRLIWKIEDFGLIWLRDTVASQLRLKSPSFTAKAENESQSTTWQLLLESNGAALACYLLLIAWNPAAWNRPTVPCQFKISMGNSAKPYCLSKEKSGNFAVPLNPMTYDRTNGWLCYISKGEFFRQENNVLEEGTLQICAEVQIVTAIIDLSPRSSEQEMKRSMTNSLTMDLKRLLWDNVCSDVEVICGTRTFNAHKNILSVRSPVFSRMFEAQTAGMPTKPVIVSEINEEMFQSVLYFMYTGQLDNEVEDYNFYVDLLHAADKYELMELKQYGFEKLINTFMCPDTVGHLVVLASTYTAGEAIKERIKRFWTENFTSLMSNEAFKSYFVQYPNMFVTPSCNDVSQHH